ncbi:DUF488 family protein [Enhygromyxa salina]|uniref:Uncharacterized protein n=1 Tax=Enhygromyxa salina TaxID=215803 RepID=A0A2S9XTY2_9BACT|nr:DUF488 family protein [Enhygromyxa salina]PRP96171.1 hypothetical protein ENSA7_69850 [Enhygromyxa salina]
MLIAAGKRARGAGTQLALPNTDLNPRSVVIASVAVLGHLGLSWALRTHGVRHLVDLRLGPLYRPFGLDGEGFFDLVAELGVRYEHRRSLADPYIGDAWHEERYRQLLEEHYREQAQSVRALRSLIDEGPVMLLLPSYTGLVQQILLRALGAVESGFEYFQLER